MEEKENSAEPDTARRDENTSARNVIGYLCDQAYTHTHTRTHTHTHTRMYAYTHTHRQTCIHIQHMCLHMHPCTQGNTLFIMIIYNRRTKQLNHQVVEKLTIHQLLRIMKQVILKRMNQANMMMMLLLWIQ